MFCSAAAFLVLKHSYSASSFDSTHSQPLFLFQTQWVKNLHLLFPLAEQFNRSRLISSHFLFSLSLSFFTFLPPKHTLLFSSFFFFATLGLWDSIWKKIVFLSWCKCKVVQSWWFCSNLSLYRWQCGWCLYIICIFSLQLSLIITFLFSFIIMWISNANDFSTL